MLLGREFNYAIDFPYVGDHFLTLIRMGHLKRHFTEYLDFRMESPNRRIECIYRRIFAGSGVAACIYPFPPIVIYVGILEIG